jgi:hypothetical protein
LWLEPCRADEGGHAGCDVELPVDGSVELVEREVDVGGGLAGLGRESLGEFADVCAFERG